MKKERTWEERRGRVHEIIEVGYMEDRLSRSYDIISTLLTIVNLTAGILDTFTAVRVQYGEVLSTLESVTVAFFAVDCILRIWTADRGHPELPRGRAVWKYIFSFTGIVDILSFLPHYMPFFFPSGAVAFRMFRVVRIFRLFRINAYYDSLNVITEVIVSKSQQLLSSVFIILVLMVASSLCMYSLEHEAQPEIFSNAFSGIWWSVSTLLTVGYGDIYPITTLGKIFGIFISFLGVGMAAIPTGIISAGFVEHYSRAKRLTEYGQENALRFIKIRIGAEDPWAGRTVMELGLPRGIIIAAIQRERKIVIPRGDVLLCKGDVVVLGAEPFQGHSHIELKEIVLRRQNPWNGQRIRDLDISRKTNIVMVRRRDKVLVPKGNLMLQEGDAVVLYTQKYISDAKQIEI